jgi:hypothetical protein
MSREASVRYVADILTAIAIRALVFLGLALVPTLGVVLLILVTPLWWFYASLLVGGSYLLGRLLAPAFIQRIATTSELPPGQLRDAIAGVMSGTRFSMARIRLVHNSRAAFFAGLGPTRAIFLGTRALGQGTAQAGESLPENAEKDEAGL